MEQKIEMLHYPKELQPYIFAPPRTPEDMYAQSTRNDQVTVDSWRGDWIRNYRQNQAFLGGFAKFSLGELHQAELHNPCILVGSGPHLKRNAHLLKDVKGIPIISCLHNFHFLEDLGVKVDYYVSLDAGPVTIEEVSEGGDPSKDYWEMTKGKKLIAYAASHPDLIAKWKGELYVFNCPIPAPDITQSLEEIEKFNVHVSTGGNVLGACMYIAKAYLGCSTTIFVGASFSFDNESHFHAWSSKYDDKLGSYIKVPDIFGYKVKTWQSYNNFCNWFNLISLQVPGEYINCTEGGTLGAYAEGNLITIQQMDLKDCLSRFSMSEHTRQMCEDPETNEVKILF